MSALLGGYAMIFSGIGNGVLKIFNIKGYVEIFKEYSKDFSAASWILAILAILLVIAIHALLIFLIVLLIRKYIRFRHSLVSNEDLLEEIVGDIWDEDEIESPDHNKISDTTYTVSGDMSITSLLELLKLREGYIKTDAVSVGGWIMENIGDIPQVGDSFTYRNNISVTVTTTSEKRVEKVKITYIPDEAEE
jgi:hypothetical protein